MGSYDYIQDPVSGQPISSSLFGANVKKAIVDLDRRVSAYDASTGIGKVSSTSALVLATTTETIALTIPGFTFRAGYAYRANIRTGISSAAAGTVVNLRLRKGSTLTLNGGVPNTATNPDYGEYFRYEGKGTANVMSALGSQYLLRSAATDLVTDVSITAQSSVAAANAITLYANTTSPRYLVIEPAGFASDYVGMGVDVT